MQYREVHEISRYRTLRFRPTHALVSIAAGPRCRVCAHIHQFLGGTLCGGHFCIAYRPDDAEFSFLIHVLCCLQDRYKLWCQQNLNRAWAPVSSLGGAEAWWWEMVNVFYSQCERSLSNVGPWLLSLQWQQDWGSARGGPILEIREFKFATTLYHEFQHCAFAIKLSDNSWWVFDPTGIQFGPDWPLLSPLNHYCLRAESSLPVQRVSFRWRILGSSAHWQYRRPPW
ncbi:uncharacterized protein M421DRAFT_3496 [Didymella exigua CBS 183.55]|uniref:Uncharacterized protein n=1 Tax=Didymella exigua CBS 183.55 TaxID=1150837 RepID=A0A6A5RYU4_9PLEO|nr:uncharacterized protein M421DRAFT_3496 [Didymella exigua CBS 183.55]KAF1930427.1 hypothetical protein M421DRAFT_3496 [Didymella exigua CBS 183.55]